MTKETRIQQGEDPTQPSTDPTPAQDREELTDAELDQVAGGGGGKVGSDF
jgi:hypothetical protein